MGSPQMVGEVNRLVAGLLLNEGGVYLPSIGSLRVERCAAKRLSKHSVLPPYRVVSFSSQQAGLSLVEAIARAIRIAGGDEEQARAIYDRWLGYTLQNEVVTIQGVGALAQKHFTLDSDFDKRLNPQGHEPMKLKPVRRFDWVVWIGSIAILFAVGFGGYQYLMTIPDPLETIAAVERPALPVIPTPAVPAASEDSTEMVDQPVIPVSAEPVVELQLALDQQITSVADAKSVSSGEMTPRRCYVVFGVFSTPENAERAAEKAATDYVGIRCNIYRFGAKWMVSCFESDDAGACADFINENRGWMPDVWTYTAK